MTVPVIITSIVNRPDLLDRMIDSVDVPVGRFLVVDNGNVGYQREGVTVWSPPFGSLGWPGTQNFGIMQTADAPWWLIVNNDAWFPPGKLAELCALMERDDPVVHHHEFTMFALNRAVVETIGLVDEHSFWPLYFDDTDYAYRCHLAGIPLHYGQWIREGDDDHPVSLTIHSDPQLAWANNRTWQLNQTAYMEKWGGLPGDETYSTPWGLDLPLWATRPSAVGRDARRWP